MMRPSTSPATRSTRAARAHRRRRPPHAAAAHRRPPARHRRRRALAQARAPAGRRQLQGARHVQPHALERRCPRPASSSPRAATPASPSRARRKALGVRCEVFVPESSSRAKRDKLAELGAVVNVVGASYADALAASLARQAESGALLMHAYDQREVVIGAGDARRRGRGRRRRSRSGAGQRRRRRADRRRLRVVRRTGARSMRSSPSSRRPCTGRAQRASRSTSTVSGIAADSLGARRIGAIAWALTQRHVDASHLLDDAAIRARAARRCGASCASRSSRRRRCRWPR